MREDNCAWWNLFCRASEKVKSAKAISVVMGFRPNAGNTCSPAPVPTQAPTTTPSGSGGTPAGSGQYSTSYIQYSFGNNKWFAKYQQLNVEGCASLCLNTESCVYFMMLGCNYVFDIPIGGATNCVLVDGSVPPTISPENKSCATSGYIFSRVNAPTPNPTPMPTLTPAPTPTPTPMPTPAPTLAPPAATAKECSYEGNYLITPANNKPKCQKKYITVVDIPNVNCYKSAIRLTLISSEVRTMQWAFSAKTTGSLGEPHPILSNVPCSMPALAPLIAGNGLKLAGKSYLWQVVAVGDGSDCNLVYLYSYNRRFEVTPFLSVNDACDGFQFSSGGPMGQFKLIPN